MEFAKILKVVLLKSFLIGVILLVLMAFSYHFYFDFFYSLCCNFYPMDKDIFAQMVFISLGIWKLVLFQIFLLPGLILHFMLRPCFSEEEP